MELADLLALTRGVAAGPTAALIHGFDLVDPPEVPHVAVPRHRHVAVPPGCRAVRVDVAPADVVWRRDLPITSPVRTVLDCARWLPTDRAVAVADSALRRRAVSLGRLRSAADVLPQSRGTSAVRRVLDLADGRAESVLESLARVALAHAGLPPPVLQLRVLDGGVEVARVDMAWPQVRLVLEVDGFAYHSTRRHAHRDRVRANRLVLSGWRVLRAGWEEVLGAKRQVVASVRSALEQE